MLSQARFERNSIDKILPLLVASAVGCAVWLGAVGTAAACSATGPEVHTVLPDDQTTVPPEVEFTVSVTGEHEATLMRQSDGTNVGLNRSDISGALITRGVYVHAPNSELQPGDYTLTISSPASPPDFSDVTRDVTVKKGATTSELPESLSDPTMSVIEYPNLGSGGGCGRIGGNNYVRSELAGLGSGAETPALVVREFRERMSATSPGETDREVLLRDGVALHLSGDDYLRTEMVEFTPACLTVTAYASDRTQMLEVETCQLDRCDRQNKLPQQTEGPPATRDDIDWSTVPKCQGRLPPLGGDAGSGGSSNDTGTSADAGRPGSGQDAISWSDTASGAGQDTSGGCRAAPGGTPGFRGLALLVGLLIARSAFRRHSHISGKS